MTHFADAYMCHSVLVQLIAGKKRQTFVNHEFLQFHIKFHFAKDYV